MNRLIVFMAILAFAPSSTVARNVQANSNSSESDERVCSKENSTEFLKSESIETSTAMPIEKNYTNTNTTSTPTIPFKNDDANATSMAAIMFRKRRAVNNVIVPTKVASSSEESEGSGKEDLATSNFVSREDSKLIDSGEIISNASFTDNSNISKAESAPARTLDSSSNEVGSGENDTPSDISINQVHDPKTTETDQLAVLKNKVQCWQKAVDNYLHTATRRRRKRRQAAWSQLFPSQSGSSSNMFGLAKSSNPLASAAETVGEALKPAMDLMTQGVDLLSDLYSNQLTKSDAFSIIKPIPNDNDTVAADQFQDQLKTLQSKLGDLGQQLQRVVNSFQQLQLPFLDNIMSSKLFPLNAPSSASNAITGPFDKGIGDKNV
jgi:hypothetical protein